MEINKIYQGNNIDILKTFEDESIDCCVTSPPYYGLRDYGTGKWVGGDPNCPHKRLSKYSDRTITGHAQEELRGNVGDAIYKTVCPLCGAVREDLQVGLEETPEEYIDRLVIIFREVKRVLKRDGTLWLNLGDSYAGGQGRWGGGDNISDKQLSNKGSLTEIQTTRRWQHDIIKPKDMIGIPWAVAFALRADGWYLRQDIIWQKMNPLPESVKDRCTKSHEYIFLLSKSKDYYFDYEAIQEPCNIQNPSAHIKYGGNKYPGNVENHVYSGNEYQPRTKNCQYDGQPSNSMHMNREYGGKDKEYLVRNKRDVWSIPTRPFKGAHFATFPEELIYPMVVAGCPKGGIVLDPFMGSGTVGVVAKHNYRNYVGCELNEEYVKIAENRIHGTLKRLF